MNDRTEQMDDLQLVALPTAVGCTEMFVRFSATEWNLRPMRDAAAQAGRALAQAVVGAANPANPGMLTARIRVAGPDLVIEIETPRVARTPAIPDGPRVGVTDLGDGRYLLWASLPLPGGMNASAVPLPRRQRRPSPAAAIEAAREPLHDDGDDVMQRILFGLSNTQDRHRR
ncbi:ATP-binding protein [Actinokineospora globicatena]|uniref:ATP-binding protein n=1 Tax=Actinokineospora globicatena TaxID=103729 RepID=UPI0020A493C8|nr:ATP-binding protein [Actinokineospora globicatena]MCP2302736.1 hypothetical protein [Actinokineospora globicatena]GLW75574.1 hypothetical protein Aglo01_00560 [Actinokineospora globicatena]GLW82414.1 hypothetical protein Aglo02_00550 [Actinokineospora globicatena]